MRDTTGSWMCIEYHRFHGLSHLTQRRGRSRGCKLEILEFIASNSSETQLYSQVSTPIRFPNRTKFYLLAPSSWDTWDTWDNWDTWGWKLFWKSIVSRKISAHPSPTAWNTVSWVWKNLIRDGGQVSGSQRRRFSSSSTAIVRCRCWGSMVLVLYNKDILSGTAGWERFTYASWVRCNWSWAFRT
jgi:hypothetical protein